MDSKSRKFDLLIWGLAVGYFVFYLPYSALIKIITKGLLPGVSPPVSGLQMLPSSLVMTAITMSLFIWLAGWWRYVERRRVFGLSVPLPSRAVALSGVGMAIIVATTALAYSFAGVSILFVLLLLRGGVLTLAPIIDLTWGRRVRWFSWIAAALCIAAVLLALSDVNNYKLSLAAIINVAAYLFGYTLRLPCMTRFAKCDDTATTLRYFVGEQLVSVALLITVPCVLALVGWGSFGVALRQSFTHPWASSAHGLALVVGALYACLCVCGTLIYLDRRENTFCIPLNRGASVLAVAAASYALTFLGEPPPSAWQLGGAGLIAVSLVFLSPLHHARYYVMAYARLKSLVPTFSGRAQDAADATRAGVVMIDGVSRDHVGASSADALGRLPRGLLFVCSGNTCRSPMAEAVGNAEIASRLNVTVDALDALSMRATSAGVSARAGARMTPESEQALRLLNVPVRPHNARSLTSELVDQAQIIFCMTNAHRSAVVEMVPSAAAKTRCLDPEGDIEDPIGKGQEAYERCARQIQSLLKLRLDQFALGALSRA